LKGITGLTVFPLMRGVIPQRKFMRLFVFDIDGTITNSVAAHQRSFEKAFGDVGISDVDTNWATYTHHTDSWIFGEIFRRNFGRSPTLSEKAAFAEAVEANFDTELSEQPILQMAGAVEFLTKIMSDSRTAYAFATGSYRQPALRKLASVGLTFPLELLVTADDFETREDLVSSAIVSASKCFGVSEFAQVVSIGDGVWDYLAARNLNLQFVGIATGPHGEKLKAVGALNVFPDFLTAGTTNGWTA
jgi:phosphoglycolate phosphatase-like HAD superfamily hydrolase